MRYSMRGYGIVSRTCSSPQIQATHRSTPIPNPPCGTAPYFRKSRYHSKADGRQPMLLDALHQQIVVVHALSSADDFAVSLGRDHIDPERQFGRAGSCSK